MRKLKAFAIAVALVSVMITSMPVEVEAVADLYRHVSSCDGTPSYGSNQCNHYIVYMFGFAGSTGCTGLTIGAGFFTMGYTWIIGGFYCGLAGAF